MGGAQSLERGVFSKNVMPLLKDLFKIPPKQVEILGGKLKFFEREWSLITGDPKILQIVRGFKLPFACKPIQKSVPRPLVFSKREKDLLDLEIRDMVLNNVIRVVKPLKGQIISNIFARPKKDDPRVRPIVNLRELNKCLVYQHFKMEQFHLLRSMIRQDQFLVRFDLKNAYWHVPVAEEDQLFLRFYWGETLYQMTVLAFGLGPAPRAFTKLMKAPIGFLRRLGFQMLIYLDDLLLMADSLEEAIWKRDSILYLLAQLGLTVNWKKSELQPSKKMEFLGFVLNTSNMTVCLTDRKAKDLKRLCQTSLEDSRMSVRELSSLIGKLQATGQAISLATLQIRNLQRLLIEAQKQLMGFECMITLDDSCKQELSWWVQNLSLWKMSPMKLDEPDLVIFSDASSGIGWGAHLEGEAPAGGAWTLAEKALHINELEMLAAERALATFTKGKSVRHVLIFLDNTVALAYLVKQGGTKNRFMTEVAKRIWSRAEEMDFHISGAWIPSKENVEADRMSRLRPNSSEWGLKPQVFREITKLWGSPDVDCFASWNLHQLEHYYSFHADPLCKAVNGLTQSWQGLFPYLFPPFCLITKVLKKVEVQRVEKAILIAPLWPNQVWFPRLLAMLADHPRLLKPARDLLLNHLGEEHPLAIGGRLALGVFLISGRVSSQRGYLRKQPRFSLAADGNHLQRSMGAFGTDSFCGVSKGRKIPLLHL